MELVSSTVFVEKTCSIGNKKCYNTFMITEKHHPQESQVVIEKLAEENKKLKDEINWFKEQFKLSQAQKFGRSTEKSEYVQFDLFNDDTDEEATESDESNATETVTYTRRKKSVGRRIDTSKLPREQQIHDLPDDEKCCKACQSDLVEIDRDTSEQLEYIPAKIKVIEHVRVKYTCRTCDTVVAGKKPTSPIPKCMAAASLLSAVIVSKYQYHLPMYRQSQIFLSNGIDIPNNTLTNWGLAAAEVLAPIRKALWEQLNTTHVLQADETPVKNQDKNKKGTMWCYLGCDPGNRFTVFAYDDSRGKAIVNDHLSSFAGILQTDGYSGYNDLRKKESINAIGCFAHCRRKFVDVVKVTGSKSGKAQRAIDVIKSLYNIESEGRELDASERKQLRQDKAKPILADFKTWLDEISSRVGEKSKLGKAVFYALNQWKYLSGYVNHGEVEIDNNWVENQIRPFALGRKNWMFVGNQRGADAGALFYSLIQTCKLNDIPPGIYLTYVLNEVEAMRKGEVEAKMLLPQFIDKSLLV